MLVISLYNHALIRKTKLELPKAFEGPIIGKSLKSQRPRVQTGSSSNELAEMSSFVHLNE